MTINGSHIINWLGILLLWVSFPLTAQVSQRAFGFIEQPSYTGLAGLGGVNLTSGEEPLMFLSNPALLDSIHDRKPSLHYLHYPGDIRFATLGYQTKGPGNALLGFGLQYANYGEFEGYDEVGFPTGTFHANEFALTTTLAKAQGVFRYGISLKVLGSVLESYQAYALVADFGVNYTHPVEELVIGLTAKQVGAVLSHYIEETPLSLPADVRIGVSYKAENMPMRFHLAARNLLGDTDFLIAQPQVQETGEGFADKLFRRIVIGTEVLVHESFQLRAGYNHLIRKEYSVYDNGQGLGGFSGGFIFRSEKFALSYSRMFYRVAGGTHLIGINTNINALRKF